MSTTGYISEKYTAQRANQVTCQGSYSTSQQSATGWIAVAFNVIKCTLSALTSEVAYAGVKSIAIPPLGCGLGGLNWLDVKPLIVSAFENLPDAKVILYEP